MIKLTNLLKEIQWLKSSPDLAAEYWFPLTPNIAKILNEGKTIKSFHITNFEKLNQLKSLEGTNKSISTMTRNKNIKLYRDLKAHWNHGVLCYLEGSIVLESRTDLMSVPDDTGRRWINFGSPGSNVSSLSLQSKFKKFIDKEVGDSKSDLKKYINASNKFAQENTTKILTKMFGGDLDDEELGDANEIIINKIKLLDCAYSDEATPEEINTINQIFPGEKIPVPVGTDEAYNIVTKFIKDRIGTLPSKIY